MGAVNDLRGLRARARKGVRDIRAKWLEPRWLEPKWLEAKWLAPKWLRIYIYVYMFM